MNSEYKIFIWFLYSNCDTNMCNITCWIEIHKECTLPNAIDFNKIECNLLKQWIFMWLSQQKNMYMLVKCISNHSKILANLNKTLTNLNKTLVNRYCLKKCIQIVFKLSVFHQTDIFLFFLLKTNSLTFSHNLDIYNYYYRVIFKKKMYSDARYSRHFTTN